MYWNRRFIPSPQYAFPFRDGTGCDGIAQHIRGGARHVHEVVDATTTGESRGTAAVPLLVTIRTSNMVTGS